MSNPDYIEWMRKLKQVADHKLRDVPRVDRLKLCKLVLAEVRELPPEQKEGIVAAVLFSMMCVSHGSPFPSEDLQ